MVEIFSNQQKLIFNTSFRLLKNEFFDGQTKRNKSWNTGSFYGYFEKTKKDL
jgi:hypothetical protein